MIGHKTNSGIDSADIFDAIVTEELGQGGVYDLQFNSKNKFEIDDEIVASTPKGIETFYVFSRKLNSETMVYEYTANHMSFRLKNYNMATTQLWTTLDVIMANILHNTKPTPLENIWSLAIDQSLLQNKVFLQVSPLIYSDIYDLLIGNDNCLATLANCEFEFRDETIYAVPMRGSDMQWGDLANEDITETNSNTSTILPYYVKEVSDEDKDVGVDSAVYLPELTVGQSNVGLLQVKDYSNIIPLKNTSFLRNAAKDELESLAQEETEIDLSLFRFKGELGDRIYTTERKDYYRARILAIQYDPIQMQYVQAGTQIDEYGGVAQSIFAILPKIPGARIPYLDVSHDIWVSPIFGSDGAPGTEEEPIQTLGKAFDMLPTEDNIPWTIHLYPGNYDEGWFRTYDQRDADLSTCPSLHNKTLTELNIECVEPGEWSYNADDDYLIVTPYSVFISGFDVRECTIANLNISGFAPMNTDYSVFGLNELRGNVLMDNVYLFRPDHTLNVLYPPYDLRHVTYISMTNILEEWYTHGDSGNARDCIVAGSRVYMDNYAYNPIEGLEDYYDGQVITSSSVCFYNDVDEGAGSTSVALNNNAIVIDANAGKERFNDFLIGGA